MEFYFIYYMICKLKVCRILCLKGKVKFFKLRIMGIGGYSHISPFDIKVQEVFWPIYGVFFIAWFTESTVKDSYKVTKRVFIKWFGSLFWSTHLFCSNSVIEIIIFISTEIFIKIIKPILKFVQNQFICFSYLLFMLTQS